MAVVFILPSGNHNYVSRVHGLGFEHDSTCRRYSSCLCNQCHASRVCALGFEHDPFFFGWYLSELILPTVGEHSFAFQLLGFRSAHVAVKHALYLSIPGTEVPVIHYMVRINCMSVSRCSLPATDVSILSFPTLHDTSNDFLPFAFGYQCKILSRQLQCLMGCLRCQLLQASAEASFYSFRAFAGLD